MSSTHPHTHKGASQSSNAAGMADTNNPEQLRKENAELRTTLAREAKTVDVAEYAPKMNVTPNAVATKD